MLVFSVMVRLVIINKSNDTVDERFNTGNKRRCMRTTMMEVVKVIKSMRKFNEIDR